MKEATINEIRSKADIVEILQRYLPLTKKGKSYVALCPFHDDHDPSMSISVDKQIYKCFVCGAGGNVFNFVRDFEKITFTEAVVRVAQTIGYPLDELNLPAKAQIDPKIQGYYDTLSEYIRYAHYVLASQEGNEARHYLSKRGLGDSVVDKFEIGYNPPEDKASRYLSAKGYTSEQCVKTNLSRVNEYGTKDVFERRIIFPIHDATGNPVGFTARAMNPNEGAKYINTTETPIYVKGNLLYNYHRALKAAKTAHSLILVEGVMDAIAFDQSGLENVVATLGTACTKEQIRLIQNAAQTVVLSYDGDEAGQAATIKVGHLLVQHRLKVEVLQNNTGLDPDEIIREQSKEALVNLYKRRISYIEFFLDYSLKRLDITNYSQKKEFARIMMQESEAIKDPFDKEMLLQRIMQVTQFTKDQLGLLIDRKPVPTPSLQTPTRLMPKNTNGLSGWAEKEILGQMLYSAQAMHEFRKDLGFFTDDLYQRTALTIINYYRTHDRIEIADFLNEIGDDPMRQLITQIVESDIYYKNYSQIALQDAIRQVKINTIDAQIEQFKATHRDHLELDADPNAYQELLKLQKLRRELKNRKED